MFLKNKKSCEKIMMFSSHFYFSRRRAGFHHLADAYLMQGYEVTFITLPYSFLKFFGKDSRTRSIKFIFNLFFTIRSDRLKSLINFSLAHPTTSKFWLDKTIGFFLNSRVKKIVPVQNYIVFESNQSLYFVEEIKKINPTAKIIYRVSDDILFMGGPASLVRMEQKILAMCDLVSVPNISILERLSQFTSNNIHLHHHGIDIQKFDDELINPYVGNKKKAVFVGNSHFDYHFLEVASRTFPQIEFHIIGPLKKEIQRENIIYYGELDFLSTIKYIKHADIGLQTRTGSYALIRTLSDSNKVRQYLYCRLSIIAPFEIFSDNPNWFFYKKNEDSIIKCISAAISHRYIDVKINLNTWSEVATELLNK